MVDVEEALRESANGEAYFPAGVRLGDGKDISTSKMVRARSIRFSLARNPQRKDQIADEPANLKVDCPN